MAWTDEKPWERQPGETAKAFEAFAIFRDMGKDRTISAVARRLGKSRALIDRWKDRWDWKERVRAYDNDLERAAHEEAVRNVKEMRQRHIGMAVQMQRKAMLALQDTDPHRMRPKELLAFIVEAAKLERDARNMIVQETAPQDEDAYSDMSFLDDAEDILGGD